MGESDRQLTGSTKHEQGSASHFRQPPFFRKPSADRGPTVFFRKPSVRQVQGVPGGEGKGKAGESPGKQTTGTLDINRGVPATVMSVMSFVSEACRYQVVELFPLPHTGGSAALAGSIINGPQIFRVFERQKDDAVDVRGQTDDLPREVCEGVAKDAFSTLYRCQDL